MKLLVLFLSVAILVPLLLGATVYGLFLLWGNELPSPQRPQEVEPARNTVLLDRFGQPITEFYVENRTPIPLVQVPEIMREAVLATEDRRFYRHWGIDAIGVIRAVLSNLAAGGITQGASTISQQLARNLFLTHSQTLERKMKEAVLAVRLERSFSKEEILELYLNQIYFGEGAYGVEAAAHRYFGKTCRDVSVAEAAMLAGLPANPAAYSPLRHPEAARRRRNAVLRKMENTGVIDAETRGTAEETPVFTTDGRHGGMAAPYFAEMVRQELIERYGGEEVYRGGLVVYTTLDPGLQTTAETVLESQIRKIEERQAMVYRRVRGISVRGDSLDDAADAPSYLQGALVAVEPQTGAIRTLVGGRDFLESRFNRAVQARRQPGSAFKPILAAEALREGWQTNSLLLDEPITFDWDNQTWSPQNFDKEFRGPVTLRYTLVKSINVSSVRLIDAVGADKVVRLARDMGFTAPFAPHLSLALGTGEVTPLEITSAYGAFVNHGILQKPYSIERVEDRHGNILQEHRPESREVLDEKSSFLMVSMLRSVIERGTGYAARATYGLEAPTGGKTGTTDDYTDAWFVGFIPRLACGVWIGFDEKKSIGNRMTGAVAALPTWSEFMKKAVETYGAEEFDRPAGITSVVTCLDSGLLALPECPRVIQDEFVSGTEPTRTCQVHIGYRPEMAPGQFTVEEDPFLDEAPPVVQEPADSPEQ